MIAGATGIDLFLLVVDAQEGARPQTLEHLAVLRLLGVDRGVVAVTKADAVDAETLTLALDEARELVPDSEDGRRLGEDRGRSRRAARRARARRRGGAPLGRSDTPLHRPRVHASRHRDDRDRDAVGRHDRRRDLLRSEPSGGRSGCGACRCTTQPSSTPMPANGSQINLPGSGAPTPTRRRARHARALPGVLPAGRPVDAARRHPRSGDRPSRDDSRPRAGGSQWRVRPVAARRAGVAARGDHVILRTETTVAGGAVLDPSPLEATRAGATAGARGGDTHGNHAGLVGVNRSAAPRQARRPARTARAGSRAGDGSRRVSTTSRRHGSPGSSGRRHEAATRRPARREPARSRGAAAAELLPAEAWAPQVAACSRSSGAARSSAFPARRRAFG